MDIYEILDLIYYLFFSTILIPTAIIISRWPSITYSERWVAWLIIFYLTIEIVSLVLRYNLIRNHFLYYFQTVATLYCGAGFFSSHFEKKTCFTVAFVVATLMLFEVIFVVGFNHINSATLTFTRVLITLCTLVVLRQLIDNAPNISLAENPIFFLNLGLFVICFFSLFTGAFKSRFIDTSLDLYYFFDTIAVMANAIGFLIIARGFWLRKSTVSKKISNNEG